MRYEEEDAEEFKQSIGLGHSRKKKSSFKEFLRWFFTVDFKDWTNYVAIVLAAFLFWWGIKNIISAMQIG